jgi:dihydroorotate dehydrogenase (fumarate)
MADLKTRYMGIPLENPFIAGASSLSSNLDTIKRVEDEGAAAIVIKSLFEEQINLESFALEYELHRNDELYAEMITHYPETIEHAGSEEHLMWVRKTKESVSMPVIASLNAVERETWLRYALELEQTGVDGLELNFYAVPIDPAVSGAEIEDAQAEILSEILSRVRIPVSVKLSPFYTSPLQFITRLDRLGVRGFVLFNRFFQPSINTEKLENEFPFNLSNPGDHRMSMRYAGLLYGELSGSICASNGIHTAVNAAEVLLAGADCVQVVSTLFRNSLSMFGTLKRELSGWMDRKGFATIDDFKGKLSRKHNPDRHAYTRAQYVRILLRPERYFESAVGNGGGNG